MKLIELEHYDQVGVYGIGVTLTQLSAMSTYTQNARDSNSNTRIRRLETYM